MKNFLKKHEKIVKILFMLLLFFLVSLVSMLIFYFLGIIGFKNGEMYVEKALFDSFKNSWYGCIFIILIQVVITSLLSFIPGTSMAFIMLVEALYESKLMSFGMAITGVFLSSFMMYAIGRFGGYGLGKKLLGEEDCEKASDLLNNKGTIFFPVMMMFPAFPDDALVMVAGTLKMSLKWFIPSIVFGRGIGVATIIFGFTTILEYLTKPWHWILFILACIIFILLVFFAAGRLNKHIKKKNEEAKEKIEK